MNLLSQINENANKVIIEAALIDKNITQISEYLSMSTEQLNEAISTWLAKVRNVTASGSLNPEKKQDVIKILGALNAISNEDLADALDEKGDLGTILFNAGSRDKTMSNAGLQRLLMIGNEPSVRTFVANVAKEIDDATAIDTLTKKIQAKIEPIMNKKLALERQKNV